MAARIRRRSASIVIWPTRKNGDPDKFDLPGVNGMLDIFQPSLARHARTK